MLVHNLPAIRRFQENKRLSATPRFEFTSLLERKVRVIGSDSNIAEHIDFQVLDLKFKVRN
jgi:hypothetical protein